MSDISQKTFAQLLDELITVSQKIWHLTDFQIESDDLEAVGRAGKQVLRLNARRNRLMAALDERFGDGENSLPSKSYDK